MGKRFGQVSESLRISARSSAEVIVGLGACPYSRLWVATNSIFGCKPRSSYCFLAWQTSNGHLSRVRCIKPKVRVVICLKSVISCRRTFDGYGKGVLCGCSSSGYCEVWLFISLYFWVSLFPGDLTMLFWWYVCLFFWWSFLFKVSLFCYVSLCGTSQCGFGFACLWWLPLF